MSITRLPFEDVFADESGGNIKTPQSEYRPKGRYPVVDQGKALIGGYVDDEARVCGGGRPAIIFGDHTRCIKYMDAPFCMGADGVKVLRPKIEADLKYLFYYLKQLHLPSAGYDRHFKYLKRNEVVLLPLHEQRRIAAILDKADALCDKRREALAQLNRLAQSIFVEMFGDPTSNSKGWKTASFEDLCTRVTVGIVVQPASYYQPTGVPAIRSLNVRPGKIVLDDLVYVSEQDNDTRLKKTKLKTGDLVLVRTGQPGTAAVVPSDLNGINAIDVLIATPNAEKCNANFLCEFFNSSGGRDLVLSTQRGQVQKHLNVGSLNAAILPVPPLTLQNEFCNRVSRVREIAKVHQKASQELDALFFSLQRRAFAGEL